MCVVCVELSLLVVGESEAEWFEVMGRNSFLFVNFHNVREKVQFSRLQVENCCCSCSVWVTRWYPIRFWFVSHVICFLTVFLCNYIGFYLFFFVIYNSVFVIFVELYNDFENLVLIKIVQLQYFQLNLSSIFSIFICFLRSTASLGSVSLSFFWVFLFSFVLTYSLIF